MLNGEDADLLRLAIFDDSKVILFQVSDGSAFRIARHHVHHHQAGLYLQDRGSFIGGLLGGASLCLRIFVIQPPARRCSAGQDKTR